MCTVVVQIDNTVISRVVDPDPVNIKMASWIRIRNSVISDPVPVFNLDLDPYILLFF
jgi:hypothetical protein